MAEQDDLFPTSIPSSVPASVPAPVDGDTSPRTGYVPGRYEIPELDRLVAGGARATRKSRCNGSTCGAVVFWVHGRRFPISVNYVGCSAPTATAAGVGVSHYVNCPNADEFSGRGKDGTGGKA